MSLDSEFGTSSQLDFRAHVIHGGLTLLPPFFTVVAVALTHNILASLYVGVFLASFLIYRFNPITAFARSFDSILTGVMADEGHVKVRPGVWVEWAEQGREMHASRPSLRDLSDPPSQP